MKIAVLRERRAGETRVAATPDTVKRLIGQGFEIAVERGAGAAAGLLDDAYAAVGASLADDAAAALAGAGAVVKVQPPLGPGEGAVDEVSLIERGALLIGLLAPYDFPDHMTAYAARGIDAFAMELLPRRLSRAQNMDALSSQANLAGYRAVIEAAMRLPSAFPLMMTAAGTVQAARVMVMGAGVAGLQAIATAKRLGAVVSATDVRPAAKTEVQSLGGTFVAVEDDEFKQAETAGGYAKEMSPEYQRKQAALIAETVKKQDVVISTALIPGRPAPVLITEEMVATMKPGAVIVDLAAERGGNCPLTRPGEIVTVHGVTIVGTLNMPGLVAADSSALYARNVMNFLTPLWDKDAKAWKIDSEDQVVQETALTRAGAVVHPRFKPAAPPAPEPTTTTESEG